MLFLLFIVSVCVRRKLTAMLSIPFFFFFLLRFPVKICARFSSAKQARFKLKFRRNVTGARRLVP